MTRFLALGDSYTIGEGVEEHARWPNQLASRLRACGLSMDVTIIARTGWTAGELWQGIQAASLQPPYNLVSLLIGVNNQYRGLPIEEYCAQFSLLLENSIHYTGGEARRVLVLSIPDWSVTPFAHDRDRARVASEIDAFNAVNRLASQQAGVCYVDVAPVSRQARDDPSLLAPDNLHPSGRMYSLWAELALPPAQAIFGGLI